MVHLPRTAQEFEGGIYVPGLTKPTFKNAAKTTEMLAICKTQNCSFFTSSTNESLKSFQALGKT